MLFTKMHGLGNDYLYVYGEAPENVAELSRKLSERHFGAGSDGMIYISPTEPADIKMRLFNADGSEAKMCGNGIRCVGKYVYDKGYTDNTNLTVETLSGIKKLSMRIWAGKVKSVSVDMGKAEVESELRIAVNGETFAGIPVSVGNPHFVIFTDDAENAPLYTAGPLIEKNPAFPEGVNVEFVQAVNHNTLRMRVWERGSGVTMACGTGACASAAAAVKRKICAEDEPITVILDGGELEIKVSRSCQISMTGPAETVYEGETVIC